MKILGKLMLAFGLLFIVQTKAQTQEYYQLKIYSFNSTSQEEITDNYLKNAYLPALKELDIQNVGVFKPRPTDSVTPKKTYVLIPFSSLTKFQLLDDALA